MNPTAWQLLGWVNRLGRTLGFDHADELLPVTPTGLGFFGPKILQEQRITSEDWIVYGLWAVAVSTNVTAFRYDEKEHQLFVAFASKGLANSRIYKYDRVERYRAEQMFRAPSLGRFVHQRLKGQYPTIGPLSPSQI